MDKTTGLPVVGMVGGGQLARMTHQAAIPLGQSLRVLAAAPDESAALVAHDVVLGSHTSYEDLVAFAAGCDVVTFDHEHVPPEHIRRLVAEGHTVLPGADALLYAQDKQVMRTRLGELGLPVPRWAPIASLEDLVAFAGDEWPVVVKAIRGGYDGRGVWVVSDPAPVEALLAAGTPLLVEELVPLRRELAAVVARSPFGQGAAWPVVQTVQSDGVCVEVLAPAPDLDPDLAEEAERIALTIAGELDVVGVLAVELFERTDGRLLINELAMRPHNSAHWTIEGARTSQFEQHLRAVLDYPLGATELTAPVVVMANVLAGEPNPVGMDERVHHLAARWPALKVHLYGKQPRPGRKIGHVTALGSDLAALRRDATAAADYLATGQSDEVTH
ncbi:MAG TPA: 5-(carboxyamino)imidazole ribonucleotide synthase [Mycobacteriales bacterium]|jgi:5-(carboxyamino)imidazole ribonucleotide synthase|nr:5-(carboxyamino)imidazole ribonucleotide synthase [Mycobacteriales bacterium]